MSAELTQLVVAERRGNTAVMALESASIGPAAFVLTQFWPAVGGAIFAVLAVLLAVGLAKRRALGKLLDAHDEISRIDRVTWLGRPAVRVRFERGGRVTLATWNSDRERVIAALETRELPEARLLR